MANALKKRVKTLANLVSSTSSKKAHIKKRFR